MSDKDPNDKDTNEEVQEQSDDETPQFNAPGSPKDDDKEKHYKLKGCTMKVVSCGKKNQTDDYMIVDLEFTFPQESVKIVELPYTPEGMKNAWMHCNNALNDVVFLEDCVYKDTKNAFGELIHQEIERYKEKRGGQAGTRKPKIIAKKICVEKIGENFYFISSDIFLLSDEVKKLTKEEIEELPVLICWEGPMMNYQTNPEECMRLLVKILHNFNLLQNRRFVSFPLAVFVAHIAGCLYKHIVLEQGNYATQVFISGDIHGTGKSLMRTLMMLIVLGEVRAPTRHLTEHTFFEILDSGDSIYVNEFVLKKPARTNEVDARFLGFAVQNLWERSERKSKGKVYTPKGVMHLDANTTPKKLEPFMTSATLSKIMFNHTGPIPLKHPRLKAIIPEMKEDAEKLHQFLPDLYRMGVNFIIPVASDIEAADIDHILKTSGDPREAQRIVIYDRIFTHIKKGIEEYNLEKPLLFETDDIDRTSLVYCNVEEEDYVKYDELAKDVVEICENNITSDLVESSKAEGAYKVDIENEIFPSRLASELRKLIKPTNTFFKGSKNKKRVIILSDAFLSEETSQKLKDLSSRYSLWSRPLAVKEEFKMMTFGTMFYRRVDKDRSADELGAQHCDPALEDDDVDQPGTQKRKLSTSSVHADRDIDKSEQMFKGLSSHSETDENGDESSPRKRIHTLQQDKDEKSQDGSEKMKFKCQKAGCKDFGKPFKTEKMLKRHEEMVAEHKEEVPSERPTRIRKPAKRFSPSDPEKSHGPKSTGEVGILNYDTQCTPSSATIQQNKYTIARN